MSLIRRAHYDGEKFLHDADVVAFLIDRALLYERKGDTEDNDEDALAYLFAAEAFRTAAADLLEMETVR